MAIKYPKIIFLNLIISILVYVFFYNDTDNSIRGIVFLGFISSFFFRENLLRSFLKLMLINSFFFFLLFIPINYLGEIIKDIIDIGKSDNLTFILNSIGLSFGFTHFYFFGYLAGIIPMGIYERFRKQGKVNLQEKL